jgi:hypothetical protein
MPWVGSKPMIPAFEMAKTFYALNRATTVIGVTNINLPQFMSCLWKSVQSVSWKEKTSLFCWICQDGRSSSRIQTYLCAAIIKAIILLSSPRMEQCALQFNKFCTIEKLRRIEISPTHEETYHPLGLFTLQIFTYTQAAKPHSKPHFLDSENIKRERAKKLLNQVKYL